MNQPVNQQDHDDAAVVQLHRLGKRFGERWILRNTSLTLQAGERVALIGESGSGKSTLLNIVAGLEAVTEGEAHVLGQALHAMDTDASARLRRQSIGFVFQAFHLLPHLRIWQNVALPLVLNGVGPARSRALADQVLGRLSLASRATDWPTSLSGGEQQRVALARALVHQPRLVLADEPTGNLDPRIAAQAIELLHELVDESGACLLMVTHSDQAARAAGRIVHLTDQQLVNAAP